MSQITFAYKAGCPMIQEVSLSVAAGEFIAIAGRNGSGKTTLTKLMMSLIKPSHGQLTFNGTDTRKYSPADMARHIGYVFQNPDRQIFRDTVAAEVAYGPEQLGFDQERTAAAVQQALAMTGLTGLAEMYPRVLSKGQKQKVAIASALAMQPKMLILDEPTSGQDAKERDHLLKLLVELNKQGIAIVLVTHDMEILARYVSRVVVMSRGVKVFDGTVSQLFAGNEEVNSWGLVAPVAVKISREMGMLGVDSSLLVEELASNLSKMARREQHE
jgi:energy-coupling factor transport system ATP-binding protein